ncbi:hypothetical protein JYU20_00530 [Bacteroidales bacterium AH-315-I05]|nr:hypothetical protein [Bacteroidales bacterium AH-315-I05]
MRNNLIIIGILAVLLFAAWWLAWRRNKACPCPGEKDCKCPEIDLEDKQVVVVSPTTGEEIIATDFGETTALPESLAQLDEVGGKVAQKIANDTGQKPSLLEYRVYDLSDKLVASGTFTP